MLQRHTMRRRLKHALLGASCLVLAGAACGGDMPDGNHGCDSDHHGLPGPQGPPPLELGFGEMRPPPYLMDAALTDDQQDKVFSILHAQAPQEREQAKAAQKSRAALRELGLSSEFDAGRAAALAQAQGAAEGQLALIRVRTDHDIYLLLTPEQRARIAQRARDHGGHTHDGPPAH